MIMNTVRNVKDIKRENYRTTKTGWTKYGYIYNYIPVYIPTFHKSLGGGFPKSSLQQISFFFLYILTWEKILTIYVFQSLYHLQSLICFLVIPFQILKFYILLIRLYVISKNFQSSHHCGIKVKQCKYCCLGNSLGNLREWILLWFSHYCATT